MARAKKIKIGRPALGNSTVRVNLKVDARDRDAWLAAAASEGMTLSEWLRAAADHRVNH